ncbi:MAG TPA: hypothetical protein VEB20_11245 [Azospirillaceae bacterium]|nr:hypothetical protein [Azospirillaceae bacterium]
MERIAAAGAVGYAAKALLDRGRLGEALECALIARDIAPDHARCTATHAAVLDALGRPDEADAAWERAASLKPDDCWHRFNRAASRLRRGLWREGWTDYESRLDEDTCHLLVEPSSFAALRHRRLVAGMGLQGRHVLVFGEQGYGDQVMFARFIPTLARRGAEVTAAVHGAVAPLIRRVPGVRAVLSPPPEQPRARLDLRAAAPDLIEPIGSLPLKLELFATADLSAGCPHLRADSAAVAHWRDWLVARGRAAAPRVGLVHQAERRHAGGDLRSIPLDALDVLKPLAGIDWVNLQHGAPGRSLQQAWPDLIDATAEDRPMDAYADLMAACDAVVSVDTLAAHIAGGLGLPLFVLLPLEADWKWRPAGDGSDWYPTARLLRQPRRGDWKAPLEALAARLGGRQIHRWEAEC